MLFYLEGSVIETPEGSVIEAPVGNFIKCLFACHS